MSSVKQVELTSVFSEKQENVVRAIRQEYNILKDLNHPNIVQFLRFEDSLGCLNLFLEYVPGVSIGDSLFANCKFSEELVRFYSCQIFCGLEYLHSRGIVHCDMKADNILVSPSGTCKISNFGKAETLVVCGHSKCRSSTQDDFWSAPEVLQKLPYNEKSDIWSAGCLILEMWTGKRPWFGDDLLAVKYKIFDLKLMPPIPEDVTLSTDAIDFKNMCLVIDPVDRSTATVLRRHPYITPAPALNLESRLPVGVDFDGGLHGNVQTPSVPNSPASAYIVEVRKPRLRPPGGRVPPNWTVTWKCARQGDKTTRLLSPGQLADQGAADKLDYAVPSGLPAPNTSQSLRLRSKSNARAEPSAGSLNIPPSLTRNPKPKRITKSADFITPDEHGWIVQMLDGPSEDLLDSTNKSSVPSPPLPPPLLDTPVPPPPPVPPFLSTLPTLSILPIPPPPPPPPPPPLVPPIPSTLPTLPVFSTHSSPSSHASSAAPTIYTPPVLHALPMLPSVTPDSSPSPLFRHDTRAPATPPSASSPPYDTTPWYRHHRRPLPTTIRPLPPIPSQPIDRSPPACQNDQPSIRSIDSSSARSHGQSLNRVGTGIRAQNPAGIRLSVIPEALSARSSAATPAIYESVSVSPSSDSSQSSLPLTNRPRLLPFPRPVIVIPPRVIGESLPPQEPVYKRVEDCFPRHDPSVPVIETARSTGDTPSPDHGWRPSVQFVTEESKHRAGQPSGKDSSNTAIARRNTKLWVTRYG